MSTSCEGIRIALKSCLIRSDCVLRQNKLPSECLKDHFEDLPDECKQLRQSLFECKRGMVCHFTFWLFVNILLTEFVAFALSWTCEIDFEEILARKYQIDY